MLNGAKKQHSLTSRGALPSVKQHRGLPWPTLFDVC